MDTIKIVRIAKDLPMPKKQTVGSAGFDLYANVDEQIVIMPGETKLIGTGIKIQLPRQHMLTVCPRSGLALVNGIGVANAPGIVDEDFRGEVGVILINNGRNIFLVNRGDRVAQAVVQRLPEINIVEVEELSETDRGEGGFGSTGV